MSFLDLVLQQPLILLSLAVVALPLLLAVLLWLFGVVQRLRATRAQRTSSETVASTVAIVDIPEAALTVSAAPAPTSAPSPAEAQAKKDAKPEVQQLLNAVFVDEAAEARYAALMDGLDEITIVDLQTLVTQIAGRMGVQHAR